MNAKAEKNKILITGASGLLGSNLAWYFRKDNTVLGVYGQHRVAIAGVRIIGADLAQSSAVRSIMEEFEPNVVIHCAAITEIDKCEQNRKLAESVNVLAVRHVVRALKGTRTKLVHISSDAVYDGVKGQYKETARVHPLSFYALTKCRAEKEALKHKNALVVRTSFYGWNIISRDKRSLAEVILEHLRAQKRFQGFTDVYTGLIYTLDLAKLLDLAMRKNLKGIYNFVCRTFLTKYDFAVKIARTFSLNESLIDPISVDRSHFTARRSKNLTLSTAKLSKALKIKIPTVEESLKNFHRDSKEGLPQALQDGLLSENYPRLDGIPYGRQSIDEEDIRAVVEVLKSKSLTQGPKVVEFEMQLCELTGAKFAVAVNSGTSALHIACLAAGIGPGDEVITSPNTFVASANCVVYCGGRPVFADIDPKTYNINPVEIEKKINEKTKAIIPVHFAGQSCDMEEIRNIVTQKEKQYGHKIFVIEDAAHALGSVYRQEKVGSCRYSDMVVMSFHPVKHVTTGEGGCVLTNDTDLRKKLRYFRSHGITSDPDEFLDKENGFEKGVGTEERIKKRWYYEQNCLGYNYRITDIQCALGISQLKKMGKFCQRRRRIVNHYNAAFKGVKWLTIPFEEKFCDSNFHLYVLQFDFEKIGMTRTQVMAELEKKRIQTQAHYIPVYTQPFYRKNFGTNLGDCPESEQYYKRCLSLPLFPAMSDQNIRYVVDGIKGLVQDK